VRDLNERLPQEELHRRFIDALGPKSIRSHSALSSKPCEMDLEPPLPHLLRLYIYNATRPPGGRPLGEHKVQIIAPGQRRGERGNFDNTGGRVAVLAGYVAEEDVFVIWDAGLYTDFAWSRNVQVRTETIIAAAAGSLATQQRFLRPTNGPPSTETVIAAQPQLLAAALIRRMELIRERLLQD
jgi:hypothetical protein